jgi:DNA-binding MarR family transcriptional regulator
MNDEFDIEAVYAALTPKQAYALTAYRPGEELCAAAAARRLGLTWSAAYSRLGRLEAAGLLSSWMLNCKHCPYRLTPLGCAVLEHAKHLSPPWGGQDVEADRSCRTFGDRHDGCPAR